LTGEGRDAETGSDEEEDDLASWLGLGKLGSSKDGDGDETKGEAASVRLGDGRKEEQEATKEKANRELRDMILETMTMEEYEDACEMMGLKPWE